MSAAGKIITGYSNPYYCLANGTAAVIARGVDVSLSITSGSDVKFYADNGIAESVAGGFSEGTVTLTVDGLLDGVREALYGLTAPTSPETWQDYKTTDSVPYVCVGFIVRFMSDGVTSYVPMVLTKCQFKPNSLSAKTQEADISFQTESLEAAVFVNANKVWKCVDTATYNTEAAAVTALTTKLAAESANF